MVTDEGSDTIGGEGGGLDKSIGDCGKKKY
jgi:hypothetical protein